MAARSHTGEPRDDWHEDGGGRDVRGDGGGGGDEQHEKHRDKRRGQHSEAAELVADLATQA